MSRAFERVLRVFHWLSKGVSRMSQACFKFQSCSHGIRLMEVSRLFQGSFMGVTRVFQGCLKGVSRMFQECFKEVSRKFQERIVSIPG